VKNPFATNVNGQAYALTVLTPIVPGEEAALTSYLQALTHATSPFAKLPRTHFGRWVIVPEFVQAKEQPKQDVLTTQYLLFTSNFDGKRDSYLDELCRELSAEAQEIWGRCVGCPKPAAGAELKRYLLHNQINTGFFYAAYPDATVPKVHAAIALREKTIALARDGQGMAPAELQQEFARRFAT
jgi:hypothetical protein